MFTNVTFLDSLPGSTLDAYLADGWYRMGQAMFTSRVVYFEGTMQTVLWLRVPVQRHRPSKSNRQLKRKVESSFRVTVNPASIQPAHEELYRKYLTVVTGERPTTVSHLLHGGADRNIFETWEVNVWDGDKLAAFSLFDLGKHAVQSIVGAYHPDYRRQSLGFYTMLAELDHVRNIGCEWYYPGYHMPKLDAMAYKLRLGQVEFLDPDSNTWRPVGDLEAHPLTTDRIDAAADTASDALSRRGIPYRAEPYRWFELPAWNPSLRELLNHPRPVITPIPDPNAPLLAITWDVLTDRFRLSRCAPGALRGPAGRIVKGVIVQRGLVWESDDVEEIIDRVERLR